LGFRTSIFGSQNLGFRTSIFGSQDLGFRTSIENAETGSAIENAEKKAFKDALPNFHA
jgi:hypothetical protein